MTKLRKQKKTIHYIKSILPQIKSTCPKQSFFVVCRGLNANTFQSMLSNWTSHRQPTRAQSTREQVNLSINRSINTLRITWTFSDYYRKIKCLCSVQKVLWWVW